MPGRVDGTGKASGAAQYCADAVPANHLYGAVLTTTSAHARVTVDVELVRSLPGVVAALGPDDDPGRPFTTNPHGGTKDGAVFARVGRFAGDIVGAVAASDRRSLEAALAHPGVVCEEPLPAVRSLDEGLAGLVCANPRYAGNVVASVTLGASRATVDEALAASPHRHSSVARLEPAPHGFLERVAAGARWSGGRCSVWSTTQCPWLVRRALAYVLEIAEDEVTMEPVYVGGGFGGKEEMALEPVAALLSRACEGQPVLAELTREQCTRRHRTRHGGRIEVETGFDDGGRFLARFLRVVFEAGPYDGHSGNVVRNALASGLRLYPDGVVGGSGLAIATNRVQGGAYRGYGATQAGFAVETHVDAIAARLAIDPIEIRRRNAARPSMRDPGGDGQMDGIRALDCLSALDERLRALGPTSAPTSTRYRRGRGVAQLVCTSAAGSADEADEAEVGCRFEADRGVISVETSTAEAGQGIYEAIAAAVRRALGGACPPVEVGPSQHGNTRPDAGMFGSRGANVTCSAAMRAAGALRDRVLEATASRLGTDIAAIGLTPDWRSAATDDGTSSLDTRELGSLAASAAYATHDVGLAFGAQAAEITLDMRTGQIRVDRIVAVHDVGTLVAAEVAREQVEGGVVQAVGGALYEHLTFDDAGVAIESGFLGQLMPTLVELPTIEVVFVEAPDGLAGATGAKGLGEAPVMGVAAAIANAVRNATGAELACLPLRAEGVLAAVRACGE